MPTTFGRTIFGPKSTPTVLFGYEMAEKFTRVPIEPDQYRNRMGQGRLSGSRLAIRSQRRS